MKKRRKKKKCHLSHARAVKMGRKGGRATARKKRARKKRR